MNRCCRIVAVFVLLLSVSIGCNRSPDLPGPRIALVLKTLNHPFFIDMRAGAERAASEFGVQLIVQAPERELDVEKQMQIIENLIQTQVDVLCITPSGSKEIIPAIEAANQAGIPVLILDTRVDPEAAQAAGVETVTFIGSDNHRGGQMAGEYLAQSSDGQAQVAILEGIPGHETNEARLRGFREAVSRYPGIEIVASQPANWERDQGFNVFQNLLEAHPGINALFACSDLMALGALEALSVSAREGVQVISFDALQEARQAIKEGRMLASVAQFPDQMGYRAIEAAVQVLSGERPPEEIPVAIELIDRAQLLDTDP